ncbi:MAG TPA: FAD-dependent oxidoreductase, partial [Elusimicrobiota bacterium]|nr:FAD-dependent oxidoreductase [Elusimicrobiota bacterium]
MSFSWKNRQAWFDSLTSNPPEVLILGGGVVGCSIAAHASAMGLNCVLLERSDLATGASGNSTGLAHAGLRYLTKGQVWYVFREGRERDRIEQLAPHWVRPFNFLFPVYRGDPFGLSMVRLGTWIYDGMARLDALWSRRALPRQHRVARIPELLDRIPGLRTDGLQGATEYFVDAQLQDGRFTLGWAQQAARHGARIITYAEASGFHNKSGEPHQICCRDLVRNEERVTLAPLVINATGAWIDTVRQAAGFSKPAVVPRQGIHLIVDQLAGTPLIFSTETPGRVFFIIPA